MDLAEIRKKARQQNAETEKSAQDGETANHLPAQFEQGEADLGLQQFFPGCQFASEEEYTQGLSGSEQNSETDLVPWLTFLLGQEEYALQLDVIRELIKPRTFTELPKVPDFVCGILSLRGEVVPIIDLGQRLKLGRTDSDSQQRIIICEGEEQAVGLLVDRIVQVVRIAKDAIEPAPLILSEQEKDIVAGVGRIQERMVILLNPKEILHI